VTTDGRMQIGGTRRLVTMRSSGRQEFGFMSRSCKGMNYKKKTDSVKAVSNLTILVAYVSEQCQ
jgi:hypothetical protein